MTCSKNVTVLMRQYQILSILKAFKVIKAQKFIKTDIEYIKEMRKALTV